ncbi:MAG: hypothetical protein EAY75_03765 [Bacteroidetes bacterium]|nr:MAG: hypothetical protein EAY75_03765 [Bacteroidota bacterium]
MPSQHTEAHLQKARLLLDQGRYKDAERELGQILSHEPNNNDALGLLARLKIDDHQPAKALPLLAQALALNPQEDYYLYLRSFAHYKLNDNISAIADLKAALAMNPYHSGYFSLYAFVLIDEHQYEAALEKANEGLALDAEDIGCLNARSRALSKLRRTTDAAATMQDSLAVDPDNDWTHTNVAWNFLERGQHRQAAHHFQEALRINPRNTAAISGMKEALKSRIAPYRWFLRYGIWLSGQGKNVRWMMALGLYLCFRMGMAVVDTLPRPFNWLVYALMALYLLAVLCSWLINPIANAFLSLHPQGRYALTITERWSSQTALVALLAGILAAAFTMLVAPPAFQSQGLVASLVLASLALPLALVQYPVGRQYTTKQWVTLGLCVLGVVAIVALLFSAEVGMLLAGIYGAAIVVGSWVAALGRG